MLSLLDINDIGLATFLILIVIGFSFLYIKKYTGTPLYNYYLYAILFKIIFTILYFLISEFWFKGGDTFAYHWRMKATYDAFIEEPFKILHEYYLAIFQNQNTYNSNYFISFRNPTESIATISSFVGFITGAGYLSTSILLGMFCFSGLWKLYHLFYRLYPSEHRLLAISILFEPTVTFWSSGILKDTYCLGAMGFIIYSFFNLFIFKKKRISSLLLLVFASIILLVIKPYILFCLLPTLLLLGYKEYIGKIKDRSLKLLVQLFFILVTCVGIFYALNFLNSSFQQYALENLADEIEKRTSFVSENQEYYGGSGYSVGYVSNNILDLILVIPNAIIVTFFRPYLWEVRNLLMLFSAIESLLIAIFTLSVLIKIGIKESLNRILKSNIIKFCLLFSLMFGVFVGLTSFNFGTLMRYKIPCISLFLVAITLIRVK